MKGVGRKIISVKSLMAEFEAVAKLKMREANSDNGKERYAQIEKRYQALIDCLTDSINILDRI